TGSSVGRIPRSRSTALTLALQAAHLGQVWPQFKCSIRNARLRCRGPVRPCALSQEYLIRIEYRLGSAPKVWVDSPALQPRSPDEKIPHVYSLDGDRPCLYYPKSDEWRPDKWLALTIMPWTLLWLFYYEIWLATGTWMGGGVNHVGAK